MACFSPVFDPGDFFFLLTNEPTTLIISCKRWGNIGQIICQENLPKTSQIRFEPPIAIQSDEVPKYEKLIREECLGSKGRLTELLGRQDIVNQNLAEALYVKRLQRQQEFTVWLFA
jgi:hypothetical protein